MPLTLTQNNRALLLVICHLPLVHSVFARYNSCEFLIDIYLQDSLGTAKHYSSQDRVIPYNGKLHTHQPYLRSSSYYWYSSISLKIKFNYQGTEYHIYFKEGILFLFFIFYYFIIHMCIQGLGRFSPLPLPPPLPPTLPLKEGTLILAE
jgi:hypothetical protein